MDRLERALIGRAADVAARSGRVWPEFATSVAVRLESDGALRVIAPHGLDELFSMTIGRNPARAGIETFRHRVATKRHAERWPRVRVIDP